MFWGIVFRSLPLSIRDGSLSLTSSSSDSLSSQLCGLCLRARRDLEVDMLPDAGFSFRSTTHFLSLPSLSYKRKKMTHSINKTELRWNYLKRRLLLVKIQVLTSVFSLFWLVAPGWSTPVLSISTSASSSPKVCVLSFRVTNRKLIMEECIWNIYRIISIVLWMNLF